MDQGDGANGADSADSADSADLRSAPVGLPSDVAQAVAALRAATDVLTRLAPRDLDGAQAAWIAAAIATTRSRLGATEAQLLPVIEADGLWAVGGARSFPVWVARKHRVSLRTAHAQVRLGRALRDDLPATAAAAAAGEITVEHAQTLARLAPTSEARRRALADAESECNEAFLVHQAKLRPVDSFAILLRRWAAASDPDADDRGYVEASDREYLELSQLPDGYHLAGQLTVEHGQAVKAALEAVTPVPAADDERTTTQRRAQALADLARVGLDHGLVGTGRAFRPRITVLIGYPTFAALSAAATDADAGCRTQTALPGLTAAALVGGSGADEADAGSLSGPEFEDGTPVPRVLLDRLACDSEINRVIFGPRSEVLDVGRTERTFLGPRRTALVARDQHCRYPTCTAPPPLCEGHHLRQWVRDHGDTSVDNGILLCWHHHDLVHRRGIEIRWEKGRWVFTDRHGHVIHDAA